MKIFLFLKIFRIAPELKSQEVKRMAYRLQYLNVSDGSIATPPFGLAGLSLRLLVVAWGVVAGHGGGRDRRGRGAIGRRGLTGESASPHHRGRGGRLRSGSLACAAHRTALARAG